MVLQELNILNYRNIREASLEFAPKLNCFVGLNGQGKTNVLDAIYLLSFAKSAFTSQDSLNITHGEEMAFVQGVYSGLGDERISGLVEQMTISCGIKRGQKKQFRRDKKDYPRLIDHIGLIPLVMISPSDQQLIDEGSDERRRFMDVVICQLDRHYLDCLTKYNALLKQRNALLKQYADAGFPPDDLLAVLEEQMIEPAEYIFKARTEFFEDFKPFFERVYQRISGLENPENLDNPEVPVLRYVSQLQDRELREAFVRTRQRDLILGWTSQGIHKDDLDMRLSEWPLKQVGSQGQQRTFVLAMKLAQALYLSKEESQKSKDRFAQSGKPILLLDDIFDRLDSERVERIVEMVQGDEFGQIFITDTDRQHLTEILKPNENAKIFHVENGVIN
ncbi:MAG: DNA replication and repair protein RecF [Paludibacteraceae bacterium]|nr:DNA replication and repair protein RecF [Paludibacteraceae bacterium]